MSFWSKVGDVFKSVGKGIVSMIPGMGISVASNAIGGAMSAKDAKRQHQYDLEKMATQHGYNIESQKLGQQFNKEMWDYTNYENQKKHLETAGLNPALLYGMNGGGGATAAGAQGMSTGIASGHEMGIKQQGRGMGLQAAAIASQIDLNKSQAEKNRAEAKKTSGVDTNLQNANIDYVIAQTSNEKIKRGLILANTRLLDAQEELQRTTVDYTKQKTDEIRWNIKLIEKEVNRLSKEIDGLDLDNQFKKETLQNRIKQTALVLQQAIADIALKGSQGRLNDAEAKAIPEKILQMWAEIGIKQEGVEVSREQMENYAQDIANRLHLGEKGLDIQEQKLIIDCITGLLNIAVQGGLTPMGKVGSIAKGGK